MPPSGVSVSFSDTGSAIEPGEEIIAHREREVAAPPLMVANRGSGSLYLLNLVLRI